MVLKREILPSNPLVSRLRYASQVIQIRSQCLHPVGYRRFKVIQGHTITLAHSDEPYIHIYGNFMETRFHELFIEHESKLRLLKTHSHNSERQGYEADKEHQASRGGNAAYP